MFNSIFRSSSSNVATCSTTDTRGGSPVEEVTPRAVHEGTRITTSICVQTLQIVAQSCDSIG